MEPALVVITLLLAVIAYLLARVVEALEKVIGFGLALGRRSSDSPQLDGLGQVIPSGDFGAEEAEALRRHYRGRS